MFLHLHCVLAQVGERSQLRPCSHQTIDNKAQIDVCKGEFGPSEELMTICQVAFKGNKVGRGFLNSLLKSGLHDERTNMRLEVSICSTLATTLTWCLLLG
jgi:hypothetical protein